MNTLWMKLVLKFNEKNWPKNSETCHQIFKL